MGADELEAPQQFTGLKDKTGVEIYEGDIIEWDGHLENPQRMEMAWHKDKQGFLPFINSTSEVIGNIYEQTKVRAEMNGIVCCLSTRFVKVVSRGKEYHFEYTVWAGWVSCTKKRLGASVEHPRHAWEELRRLHDPEIRLRGDE